MANADEIKDTKKEPDEIWSERKRTIFGLPWTFTKYILKKSKFVTREGLFNLKEDEFDLYKVTDKKLLLPFWQRIIGCGSILLYIRDTDTPQKEIHCVKNPRDFLQAIEEQINAERDRYNTRGRDLYGERPPHHGHHMEENDCDCDYCDCGDDAHY